MSLPCIGPYGVIHVIPGKISNIFDAEEETLKLIHNLPGEVLEKNRYKYVQGGVLDVACREIGELPDAADNAKSTCLLNTFFDIKNLAKPVPVAAAPVQTQVDSLA